MDLIRVTIDGLERKVPKDATLAKVFAQLEEPVKHALVELNGVFVHARDYDKVSLQEGDKLEIIYPAFGG
jgi:thiamine biosynthesis protein ThiS